MSNNALSFEEAVCELMSGRTIAREATFDASLFQTEKPTAKKKTVKGKSQIAAKDVAGYVAYSYDDGAKSDLNPIFTKTILVGGRVKLQEEDCKQMVFTSDDMTCGQWHVVELPTEFRIVEG